MWETDKVSVIIQTAALFLLYRSQHGLLGKKQTCCPPLIFVILEIKFPENIFIFCISTNNKSCHQKAEQSGLMWCTELNCCDLLKSQMERPLELNWALQVTEKLMGSAVLRGAVLFHLQLCTDKEKVRNEWRRLFLLNEWETWIERPALMGLGCVLICRFLWIVLRLILPSKCHY